MGRRPKTLAELLKIGEVMTQEQFDKEFKDFSATMVGHFHDRFGDDLAEPSRMSSGTAYQVTSHCISLMRTKYENLKKAEEESREETLDEPQTTEQVTTQQDVTDLPSSRDKSVLDAFTKYQKTLSKANKDILKGLYGEGYERVPEAYPKDKGIDKESMEGFIFDSIVGYIKSVNSSNQTEKKPEIGAADNTQNNSEKKPISDYMIEFVMRGFTEEQRNDFNRYNLERFKSEYPSDMDPCNPDQVRLFFMKKIEEEREKNNSKPANTPKRRDGKDEEKTLNLGETQSATTNIEPNSAVPREDKRVEVKLPEEKIGPFSKETIEAALSTLSDEDRELLLSENGGDIGNIIARFDDKLPAHVPFLSIFFKGELEKIKNKKNGNAMRIENLFLCATDGKIVGKVMLLIPKNSSVLGIDMPLQDDKEGTPKRRYIGANFTKIDF